MFEETSVPNTRGAAEVATNALVTLNVVFALSYLPIKKYLITENKILCLYACIFLFQQKIYRKAVLKNLLTQYRLDLKILL